MPTIRHADLTKAERASLGVNIQDEAPIPSRNSPTQYLTTGIWKIFGAIMEAVEDNESHVVQVHSMIYELLDDLHADRVLNRDVLLESIGLSDGMPDLDEDEHVCYPEPVAHKVHK